MPKSATAYIQASERAPAASSTGSKVITSPTQSLQIPFKTLRVDLMASFPALFEVLHLMHEDLKLNKLSDATQGPRLARVLLRLALAIDPYRKSAYI
jgi:hypothetical protein